MEALAPLAKCFLRDNRIRGDTGFDHLRMSEVWYQATTATIWVVSYCWCHSLGTRSPTVVGTLLVLARIEGVEGRTPTLPARVRRHVKTTFAYSASAVRHPSRRSKPFFAFVQSVKTFLRACTTTVSGALPFDFLLLLDWLLMLLTMTIWDTLTGRSQSKPQTQTATPANTSQAPSSDPFQPRPLDPSSVQDVSSFLGAQNTFNPAALHPLAGLNQDTLDYLSLEDTQLTDLPGARSALPSRGWSDDLCYGTGVTYLAALSIGGAWGLAEGLNRSPSSAPPKLRLNSVLNAVTRRGPFLGNSAGVIAMVYNGFNSTLGYCRGKHDSFNSVAAGAMSGMLFKSTKGFRPMLVSGGMVAGTAGAWTVSFNPQDVRSTVFNTEQIAKQALF